MAAFGRRGACIVCLAVLFTLLSQNTHQQTMLEGIPSGKTRVLDLSYAINDKLVPWPGDAKFFEAQVNASVEKNGYFTRSFWMLEHYGTHLDAPIHFPPGKTTVDKIPTKQFFGPAVLLDVRADGAQDSDFQLPVSRVEEWENRHGRIPEGAITLLRTGWSARWPDAQKYCNQDAKGQMHFPGYSVDAVKLLIERNVSGLGCDTPSTDSGASTDFGAHHLALGPGL